MPMITWKMIKHNPHLLTRYLVREKVYDGIRAYFKSQDFHEVETPILVPSPSNEPYLEVFQTTLLDARHKKSAYLIMSPEYALKKLLAAGMARIFQLSKCFRNAEGKSPLHNPEFTMLEWYRTKATYKDIMDDCEKLLTFICQRIKASSVVNYQGKEIDLSPPWERLSVEEAFEKYAHVSVLDLFDRQKRTLVSKKKGYVVDPSHTGEQLFHQIFLNEIEGKLGRTRPTILYDYPSALSSYARTSKLNSDYVERFEFYIAGIELANAFSELVDAKEQRKRLIEDAHERGRMGFSEPPIDEDFLSALASGVPECAGIAVGVDRLVMLFANARSIQDTLFFPAEEIFSSD